MPSRFPAGQPVANSPPRCAAADERDQQPKRQGFHSTGPAGLETARAGNCFGQVRHEYRNQHGDADRAAFKQTQAERDRLRNTIGERYRAPSARPETRHHLILPNQPCYPPCPNVAVADKECGGTGEQTQDGEAGHRGGPDCLENEFIGNRGNKHAGTEGHNETEGTLTDRLP